MQFPNAHSGVKKIFTAEILSLIGVVLFIAAAIAAFGVASIDEASNVETDVGEAVGLAVFVLFGLAAAILSLIGFILNLIGISSAMKDEPTFKTAMTFALIGIGLSAVSGIFSGSETVSSFVQILVKLAELFVSLYVVQGIMKLAEKLNNSDMVARGSKCRWWLVITFCIPTLIKLVSAVFTLTEAEVAGDILSLVAAVLAVVAYLIYLGYLSRAKKMLAA